MKKFFPFPSIGQFSNAIRHVVSHVRYDGKDVDNNPIYNNDQLPTIPYIFTVKTHGTNAAVQYDISTQEFSFQSRERILTLEQDNAGFMLYMSNKTEVLKKLISDILDETLFVIPNKIVIFGEWAGGNIQKGVAVTGLDKMFIIFGVQYVYEAKDITVWLDLSDLKHIESKEDNIYNVLNFPTFELDIDFEKPELAQNKIVEWVTQVENECPIGFSFGSSGIGEGLVGTPKEQFNDSGFWFKAKGLKHSVTKVKTIASIDTEEIETIREYVDMFVTENRMEQMLQKMKTEKLLDFEMKNLGEFIRLVFSDTIKESQDEIIKNQLDVKKLGKPIADIAKRWYINSFNKV